MSHENAKLLYQASHAAQQKFEYFLTGAIGALFAYSVQNYTPSKIAVNPSALELLAIACFAVAFILGLKRIESLFHHTGISMKINHELGDAQALEDALLLLRAEPHKHQPRPGLSVDSMLDELRVRRGRAQSGEGLLERWEHKARSFYTWRNRFLYSAFLLLFAAKMLNPYFDTTKSQTEPQQSEAEPRFDPTTDSNPTPQK